MTTLDPLTTPDALDLLRAIDAVDDGVLAVSRYNAWGEEAERLLRTLRAHERPEE